MVSGTRFLEKTFMKDTNDGEFFVESIKLISLDILTSYFIVTCVLHDRRFSKSGAWYHSKHYLMNLLASLI
jgi:hypothetical protein